MTPVTTGTISTARRAYERDGWCATPEPLADHEIARLRTSVDRISREERPEVVHEHGTRAVRAIHGCHRFDAACARLVRLPRLVDLAETLVGGPVYVYQFKVNLKPPVQGGAWPWHQDFAFWHREDGMPRPDAVNIAVFLDEVHEANGPLQLIPGSHRLGLLDTAAGGPPGAPAGGDWRRHVSADLEHTVPGPVAEALAAEHGRRLLTGPAGSCVAFHPSVVHSSSDNVSTGPRAMALVTYNSVGNAPGHPVRPEFLVDRDTTPVVRLDG